MALRIVAGRFRGKVLTAPKGEATRPTSDRARQAVFNILEHADWSPGLVDLRVIDLFAGSGALGFEALSRDAAYCLFVETDPDARGAIRENADAMGLFGVTRIHRRDCTDLGAKPAGDGEPFARPPGTAAAGGTRPLLLLRPRAIPVSRKPARS